MPWTKRRLELFETMKAKADEGSWTHIPDHPGYCIRWDRVQETPDWIRDREAYKNWDPQYTQHVFITLATPDSSPLMSVHPAPWVTGRMGIDLTLKRAFEVLANPVAVLEPGRV